MSIESVTLGLEKLATHGGLLQIRDHLLDHGITGVRGNARSCVISRYLRAEGFVSSGEFLQVVPDLDDKDAGYVRVGACHVPLPRVLNQFARLFDHGGLPELARNG